MSIREENNIYQIIIKEYNIDDINTMVVDKTKELIELNIYEEGSPEDIVITELIKYGLNNLEMSKNYKEKFWHGLDCVFIYNNLIDYYKINPDFKIINN